MQVYIKFVRILRQWIFEECCLSFYMWIHQKVQNKKANNIRACTFLMLRLYLYITDFALHYIYFVELWWRIFFNQFNPSNTILWYIINATGGKKKSMKNILKRIWNRKQGINLYSCSKGRSLSRTIDKAIYSYWEKK